MSPRKLRFESLESRRVCAGNVKVSIVGDELQIVGDAAANYVSVQKVFNQGQLQIQVTGLPFKGEYTASGDPVTGTPGTDATSINGQAFPFYSTAAKVSISMRGGNDAVNFGGDGSDAQLDVASLQASLGTGNDYLHVKSAKVFGSAATNLRMTQVGGDVGRKELGKDKLVIESFSNTTSNLNLFTGDGNDQVLVSGTDVQGSNLKTIVDTAGGNDLVTMSLGATFFTANTGTGNDTISLSGGFHEATINAGDGTDKITVKGAHGADFVINAGNGSDTLSAVSVGCDKFTANMGASAHRDIATIEQMTGSELFVYMGAGNNDLLTLTHQNSLRRRIQVSGGDGTGDTFRILSSYRTSSRSATGFEVKPQGW